MASEKDTLEGREEKDAAEVEEKGGVKKDGGEVQMDKVGEEEENHEMEEEKGIENEKEEGNEEKKEQEEGNAGEEEDREDDGGKSKEEDEEENSVKKSVKKGSRKKKGASELSSPRTPGSERPTRERKVVERFVVNATSRGSASKPLAIEKGRGTQLKDIPNVAFKLSKRKADENLQLLHTILFGKKSKVHTLKKNIGLFSGFVWFDKEEKQRAKLKEKIDKCVKEKLLDFCDVLNIPVNRAGVKKEELSTKLLEFLESPQATTDTLLADKEKKRKNKDSATKTTSSSNMDAGKSTKKHKLDLQPEKKRKHSTKEEDNDKSDSSQNEDEGNDKTVASSESDHEEGNSEEAHEDLDEPKKQSVIGKGSSKKSARKDTGSRTSEKSKSVGKGSPAEASKTPGKSTKKSSSSASRKSAAEAESKIKIKAPLAKKQKVNEDSDKDTSASAKNKASSKKQSNKSSIKILEKDQGKGKSSKMAKKEPSKEEMHAVVVDILKEVDFNATTLSDILRQLGNHFEIDLMHRKAEVKAIITEAINNMSDDEVEEAESGDDSGKDEKDEET